MNKTSYWRLMICGAPLLLGSCAQVPHTEQPAQIQALFRVSNSDGSAYGCYLLGIYYAGQNRPDKAEAAFRQAIQLDPNMADARNALAMIYSAQGRYDEAAIELVKAVRASPATAKFHNNLGYVYYLKEDYAGAVSEFRSALARNPYHALASNNLEASCERLGVVAQRRLVLLARGQSRDPVPAPCAKPSLANNPIYEAVAKLVDEARVHPWWGEFTKAIGMPAVAPDDAVAEPSGSPRDFRLEIANGNGVPGLARRMRNILHQSGSPQPRVTNLKSFTQRDSAIQYRTGFHEAALLLSLKMSAHPRLFHQADMSQATDVRLVLGKDIAAHSELTVQESSGSERFADAVPLSSATMSGESHARHLVRE